MRTAFLSEMKVVAIKIPDWIGEEELTNDVERLLEEKYGVVSIKAIRRRLDMRARIERVEVDERYVLSLREAEKRRLPRA